MASISSESVAKMEDEVYSLLHLFNTFKMAGRSATLVLSTKGGKTTTAKLEVELSNTKAPSTLPTPPGCQGAEGRHRPQRSAAKRAKANARAAQHRVHQALPFPGSDYGAAVGPPRCFPIGRSEKPKSWKSKNGQADYLPRHSPDVRTVFEI